MNRWTEAATYFGANRITRSNWLIRAGDLSPGEYLTLYPRGELDWRTAQAALDAQYGRGCDLTASTHGGTLRVHRYGGIWKNPR